MKKGVFVYYIEIEIYLYNINQFSTTVWNIMETHEMRHPDKLSEEPRQLTDNTWNTDMLFRFEKCMYYRVTFTTKNP